MHPQTTFEIVVSNPRQTLSARVQLLDNLRYNRYSIFFNQQITEVGPSHMIISKHVSEHDYLWRCEEMSMIQDDELALSAGKEIDTFLTHLSR